MLLNRVPPAYNLFPYPLAHLSMPSQDDSIEALQRRIAHLEKHVEAQDAEIYQISKRVDTLVKVAKAHKAQLAAVAELNSSHADMPADEKPPHY